MIYKEEFEALNAAGIHYVVVGGIDELIAMKRATGRSKDEEDADRLQEIRALEAEDGNG